jgi:hypothetical protein
VNVTSAKGLPKILNCNPFVTYQFKFEKALYTTEEIAGVQPNPEWNYSNVHKIDEVTQSVADDLKKGSISFMVYAYPPARSKMA